LKKLYVSHEIEIKKRCSKILMDFANCPI
jgi:hypothetical protein